MELVHLDPKEMSRKTLHNRGRTGLLLTMLIAISCESTSVSGVSEPVSGDPSPHASRFINLDGFRINYLEWGTAGENIVIVPGLGDSPHLFDQFAPNFTDEYRVISYARRGHGQSTLPPNAQFDNETLTEDLRQLMDTLGIETATLIGFSMGGNEVNRFAVLYPERVERIIYLDVLDHADPQYPDVLANWPLPLENDETEFQTKEEAYEWLITKSHRLGLPRSEALWASVSDSTELAPSGRYRFIVDEVLSRSLFESVMTYRKDYAGITAPTLALFALPDPRHYLQAGVDSETEQNVINYLTIFLEPWMKRSQQRFREESPNGSVVEFPLTHHALFLHRPGPVLSEVLEFLTES